MSLQIAKGAEAEIYHSVFLGRRAIVKMRSSKRYRTPELDNIIKTSRTKNEARLMREARKAGIKTPVVYDIDLLSSTITMESVDGRKVKDVLDEGEGSIEEICRMIGLTIANLHNAGITHGDLTTSNMILTNDCRICLIDLSMGKTKAELEDMGVDIRLLERAFSSAHPELADMFGYLMEAYLGRKNNPDQLLKKLDEIKNRGRYT